MKKNINEELSLKSSFNNTFLGIKSAPSNASYKELVFVSIKRIIISSLSLFFILTALLFVFNAGKEPILRGTALLALMASIFVLWSLRNWLNMRKRFLGQVLRCEEDGCEFDNPRADIDAQAFSTQLGSDSYYVNRKVVEAMNAVEDIHESWSRAVLGLTLLVRLPEMERRSLIKTVLQATLDVSNSSEIAWSEICQEILLDIENEDIYLEWKGNEYSNIDTSLLSGYELFIELTIKDLIIDETNKEQLNKELMIYGKELLAVEEHACQKYISLQLSNLVKDLIDYRSKDLLYATQEISEWTDLRDEFGLSTKVSPVELPICMMVAKSLIEINKKKKVNLQKFYRV